MPDIGDELYALPPQSFTAARNTRVAEARNSGDREAAERLAALKRPTVSAWLVNLVALRRPAAVAELIAVGESIRAAQGTLTPGRQAAAALRDLSTQRRQAIDAVLADVRALAAEAGDPAPDTQHLAEAESTFAAAMADEESARLVRSGRLLKPLSYSGFGQPALGGTASSAGPGRRPQAAVPADTADVEARRAAAQARVDEARGALADAVEAEREAVAGAERVAEELSRLRERHEEARVRAHAARQARVGAERDLAAMERRLAKLEPGSA